MNDPSQCDHDFRIVFPRHVTGQAKTGEEKVLFVVCCGCGKSPIFFMQLGRELARSQPAGIEWPDDLKIIDFEWDRGEGPSVEFRRRQSEG